MHFSLLETTSACFKWLSPMSLHVFIPLFRSQYALGNISVCLICCISVESLSLSRIAKLPRLGFPTCHMRILSLLQNKLSRPSCCAWLGFDELDGRHSRKHQKTAGPLQERVKTQRTTMAGVGDHPWYVDVILAVDSGSTFGILSPIFHRKLLSLGSKNSELNLF